MRTRGGITLIYVAVGIYVAWDRGYVNFGIVKQALSAILAIFLWFLILLGIDLHVH
jgi:hypothetical protein